MVRSVAILIIWMAVLPTLIGTFASAGMERMRVSGGTGGLRKRNLPFLWVCGQTLLWALFQLISVPCILAQERFGQEGWFGRLVLLYQAAACILAAAALILTIRRFRKMGKTFQVVQGGTPKGKWYYVLWTLFWVLLVFQLVQAVRLTYGDGDDAYYVAVATLAEESDTMYMKLPYTGGSTGLDVRHSLAPFPIWLAFLARVSGMRTVSVAHVAVPLMLLPMTYAIYYLIGRKICGKNTEKLPLFLVLTEILVLFGDYSFYTAENFMIARSRQGKAALGSIVIPLLIFLLLTLLERMKDDRRVEPVLWVLLSAAMTAGCLCSTLGALLSCMLVGVTGLCAAVCFRKWKVLISLALCCLLPVLYAVLYLMMG